MGIFTIMFIVEFVLLLKKSEMQNTALDLANANKISFFFHDHHNYINIVMKKQSLKICKQKMKPINFTK